MYEGKRDEFKAADLLREAETYDYLADNADGEEEYHQYRAEAARLRDEADNASPINR